MFKKPHNEPTPIETDAVWKLLGNTRSYSAGPRFADDVVRLSRRHAKSSRPWWLRWLMPVPATVLAGGAAATAVVVGFFTLRPAPMAPLEPTPAAVVSLESKDAGYAYIQEVLETEMLFAAVEHLDQFSDEELIALMGF